MGVERAELYTSTNGEHELFSGSAHEGWEVASDPTSKEAIAMTMFCKGHVSLRTNVQSMSNSLSEALERSQTEQISSTSILMSRA